MDALTNALGYVGDSLDKPGRAVRGALAGKGREALAAVPFSDSLGITDAKQRTSGRDLTDLYGITRKGDHSFGSSALGFGAEMLTDPMNLVAGYGAYKAAPTLGRGLMAAGKAASGLDILDGLRKGGTSLLKRAKEGVSDSTSGLLNDLLKTGPSAGMDFGGHSVPRNDPDFVNSKTFWHGTGNRDLTPDHLDPNVTDIQGLFGPGIYTTDSRAIADGYAASRGRRTGTPSIYRAKSGFNRILDLDNPASRDFTDAIENAAGNIDPDILKAVQDAHRSGGTGADVYKAFRGGVSDFSHGEQVPLSEFYDHFSMLTDDFRRNGIDAFTHTGGLRTQAGQAHGPHQVVIGLDPNDFARVAPPTPYKQFSLESRPAIGTAAPPPSKTGAATGILPWNRATHIHAAEGVPTIPIPADQWQSRGGPGAAAHYVPGDRAIELNMGLGAAPGKPGFMGIGGQPGSPGVWSDNAAMKDLMDSNFLMKHFSSNHPDHLAFHELGHALHHDAIGDRAFKNTANAGFDRYEAKDIRRLVGGYASSDPAELVSEIYAALGGGRQWGVLDRIPVQQMLETHGGTKLMDKMSNQGLLKGVGLSALLAAYGLSSHGQENPGA